MNKNSQDSLRNKVKDMKVVIEDIRMKVTEKVAAEEEEEEEAEATTKIDRMMNREVKKDRAKVIEDLVTETEDKEKGIEDKVKVTEDKVKETEDKKVIEEAVIKRRIMITQGEMKVGRDSKDQGTSNRENSSPRPKTSLNWVD